MKPPSPGSVTDRAFGKQGHCARLRHWPALSLDLRAGSGLVMPGDEGGAPDPAPDLHRSSTPAAASPCCRPARLPGSAAFVEAPETIQAPGARCAHGACIRPAL